jgi:hypothetical protein
LPELWGFFLVFSLLGLSPDKITLIHFILSPIFEIFFGWLCLDETKFFKQTSFRHLLQIVLTVIFYFCQQSLGQLFTSIHPSIDHFHTL